MIKIIGCMLSFYDIGHNMNLKGLVGYGQHQQVRNYLSLLFSWATLVVIIGTLSGLS